MSDGHAGPSTAHSRAKRKPSPMDTESTAKRAKSSYTSAPEEQNSVESPSQTTSAGRNQPSKAAKKGKQKESMTEKGDWPQYFEDLYKIYKALNTVIAFCSSRQHIATTFSVVRKSVERLLKKPLDLNRVAEIKAILPDLIRFAYIPSSEIRIHADSTSNTSSSRDREGSPDLFVLPEMDSGGGDQVLVLEFVDTFKGKKPDLDGFTPMYSLPNITPEEVKKLIERRNKRFVQAVNELIEACVLAGDQEDPVALVIKAAADHTPLDPYHVNGDNSGKSMLLDTSFRKSVDEVLADIEASDEYREQIIHRRIFDEKEAQWGELDQPLDDSLREGLKSSLGVQRFYSHQAKAINALRQGKHVIISTGTASGKSVIYQVPFLSFLQEDPTSTAMFVFPTKALAQDQKTALEHFITRCPGLEHIQVATYDGDTPMHERADVRQNASVIFTNFDMVHVSVLPHEDTWRRFLKNMKLVVVDELHYYTGTLGSHAAFVMRRLRRVCAALGNRRMLFVSCSATIANPAVHMKNIFGIEDMEVITEDGSPAGRKDFIIWHPPLIDNQAIASGKRVSSLTEACTIFRYLVTRGVKTILFCKIRKICELAMKTVRAQLAAAGRGDLLDKIRPYRGGYSQQDRRDIEKQAFAGKLIGIIATNALELGINIGSLDAVVMSGFPFSVASLRQQAGRAGRRLQDSLAVLVPDPFPMDQHFVKNPHDLFDQPMADLIVDIQNEVILEGHLQCAADEMPILPANDEQYFGPTLKSICESRLTKDGDGWYHTNPKFKPRPSSFVSLRGGMEIKYMILDVTRSGEGRVQVLEELEASRVLFETYEGGIFMHQGNTYLVQEVSHDDRTAKVIETDVNWLTSPRDFTDIDPVQTDRIRAIRNSPVRAFYGRIALVTIVFGFFKVRNGSVLDVVDLESPPYKRETVGMWIDVPEETLDLFRRKGLNPAEGIHAAEHAVMNMSPLVAFASDGDVKTECKIAEKEYAAKPSSRKRPARLIFYDGVGKSSGVTAKAFDHTSDILEKALRRVESCDCEEGCPSCIESSNCRSANMVMNKLAGTLVLRGILELPIDEDSIPDPDPDTVTVAALHETVVQAVSIQAAAGITVEEADV